MTPLKLEQKESILNRLAFLEAEIEDLKKLESTTWKEYSTQSEIRRNIERLAENVANACIDIAKIILAGEAAEMPATYKEVIQKIYLIEIIPQELSDEVIKLVDIRNTLAHQYLDIKWDKIKFFLKEGLRIVKTFASLVEKSIL